MHESILTIAARLSDGALVTRLKVLASDERESTVELLAHLAEFDHRKAYLAEGHGSLFRYCTAVLRLSEDAACNRIVAARAVRRFPVILDLLADGSVNLTTLRLLAQHLTEDNHRAVLKEATRRSNREVEVIVARLAPRPDVAPSIRKLPAPPAPAPAAPQKELPTPSPQPTLETARPVAPPPLERPMVAPLSPERYRIHFTVDKETLDQLRRLQDLLRREIPSGDPGAIFARSLPLLLREVEKKKLGAKSNPRRTRGTARGSRHIPAHVRRAVYRRDAGRCAFVGRTGRCSERAFLELHHVMPHGIGGEATVENISLRCRAHNVHESELVFGPYQPSRVGETSPNYAVSGRIPSVPERITTPPSRVVRMSP